MCFSNGNLLTPFLAAVGVGGVFEMCFARKKEREKKVGVERTIRVKTRLVTLDPAVSGRRR